MDEPLDLSLPKSNRKLISAKTHKTFLKCDYCDKRFDRPSLLKRHRRTHTGISFLIVKVFFYKRAIYSGEKPHICDVCNKGFSTSSSLNTHRRIHSGLKPHVCIICGKCFTASSNLYYHKMTHSKVRSSTPGTQQTKLILFVLFRLNRINAAFALNRFQRQAT